MIIIIKLGAKANLPVVSQSGYCVRVERHV